MINNKKTRFNRILSFVSCFALVAVFGAALAPMGAGAESNGPQISRDLTVNSVGEDVRSLQKYLNSIGYKVALAGPGSPGSETTRFGLATKAALIKYQAANGLPATGYCGSQTRALLSGGGNSTAVLLAKIQSLQQQIAALQALLDGMGDDSAPSISSIKITDGGDKDYIDQGDYIAITFSEAIDPESVNDDLDEGDTVTGVTYSETGGVSVSSAGKVTIKGIASFDMGSVEDSENFKSKLALSSTGKILTITLTGGEEVAIKSEDFTGTAQIGGTVEDKDGNEMKSDSSINEPTGTFGGDNNDDSDDDSDDEGAPDISSIKVSDGGDEGYVDIGDSIAITFSEAIDPESVNDDLDEGDTVTSISSTKTGGVSVSSGGTVTIKDIATFDLGSVEAEGKFISKIALNSTGKILTITLTSGSDVDITDEDFDNATQSGDTIEDKNGNKMEFDNSIDDPTGTFGGDKNGDDNDEEGPYISSIKVTDGGDEDQIDVGDYLAITFSEAIDPKTVNDELDEGKTIENVDYWSVGGVSVSSAGKVTVEGIASFSMGEVDESGDFNVKLNLNSTGKILTVTLFSGDDIGISDEDFDAAGQIGGTVEDIDGNEMESDSSISDPSGTFGGGSSSNNNGPYISSIKVADGGEEGYIDTKDSIAITFNEAIDPESVNDDLDEGETVTGIGYSEIGGVSVSTAGKVTIKGIATFDMGSVDDSGNFTSKIALNSTGKILTVTLTSGSDVEITNEDFSSATQTGGTIEDQDGNEMESDSSISDPSGTFGGEN